MLSSKFRIKKSLFQTLHVKGKSFHSPNLSLRFFKDVKNKEIDCHTPSRFAFIVSKKNLKLSTKRNALRRRGYRAARSIFKKIKPCFVCAFYFKKGAEKLNYSEIENEVIALLKKADAITNAS